MALVALVASVTGQGGGRVTGQGGGRGEVALWWPWWPCGGPGGPGGRGDRAGRWQGLEIVFRVGMALLQFNQAELVQLDMEGMSQYFQKVIPHQFDSCPDKLILRACQVKYNPRKMKRLEKEYAALKSKEMEEQIEIKRLRSENRLLKQRIETLEKESAALADRLIQGQVTRAQEAEENDVIRRELALVRVCGGRWQEPRALHEAVLGAQLRESQAQARFWAGPSRPGRIQQSVLGRAEQACAGLREQLRAAAAQSQGLQAQLSESHRKHAEAQCKSKEEVMAVRLREADSMAALAEMRQRVAELEIQREEGRLQGQLEHSDAAQYIRHLQGHIRQLKAEIRLLRGPLSFGAVALGTRLGDEDSLGSSDEELPPPFALTPGDIGDTGDSSDSEPEVVLTAP
ncbi:ecotropic viral integration site 5 protein homolog [Pyrgilauda ruficollis]|uniref:ecotropic viral integration site 5 protein homolog n=1 Tax=Pyrgilauda ruficollis TaxID=221976 RepID=UPI001B85F9EC|nr:ecotropic viral integration site 5 protein homolog [Pyrgilauda ruficollis]